MEANRLSRVRTHSQPVRKTLAKRRSIRAKLNPVGATPEPEAPLPLAKEQLWKTPEGYIQIMDVGKTLAHYKKLTRLEARAVPVKIISISALQEYLRQNGATLTVAANEKLARC